MKTIITLLTIVMFNVFTIAQTVIPNFSLTDISGTTYNLYNELDAGKTVVLDFFSLQCGSCQTGISAIENVWQTYGNNGNDLWVWAIEMTGANHLDIDDFVFSAGGTFTPLSINENDTLYSFFDITYTPQYFVICPNRYIKSCGVDQIETYLEACSELQSMDEGTALVHQTKINSINTKNGVEVSFTNSSTAELTFEVFDILGNKITQTTNVFQAGVGSVMLSEIQYARGYYFVRVLADGKFVESMKFVAP